MERPRHRIIRILKWTLAAAVLIFVLFRVYFYFTDDFRLGNITYPLPFEANWQIAEPSAGEEQQLNEIFNQPFYYLGKGAQSYAFASEDGRYVLKFFKFKHLRPSLFIDNLPSVGFLKSYKEKQIARKKRKLFGVFKSYKLAFDTNKNESGLLYIQLNTEDNPERFVTLIDKIGIKRTINLQNYPFILQNKGETLRTVINGLLKNGDVETAKVRLGQILDMYAGEYRKGVFDHDHGVMQNTGFVGDQPIHLDVGKLLQEEKMLDKAHARKDAELVVEKMKSWVKKNYPQYSRQLEDFLNEKMDQLF
ncbi:MAG TPA: hypothetical protein VGP47_08190 [Parachlamydiaceae bacterium]|nr:hypothetical protein [Parachlamydiaceae bacterium]